MFLLLFWLIAFVLKAIIVFTVIFFVAILVIGIAAILKIGAISWAGFKDLVRYPSRTKRMMKGLIKFALVVAFIWHFTPSCGVTVTKAGIDIEWLYLPR